LLIVVPHLGGGGVERVFSYLTMHIVPNHELIFTLLENRYGYYPIKNSKIYIIKNYSTLTEFLKSLLTFYRILLREKPVAVMGRRKGLNLALLSFGSKIIIRVENYPGKPMISGLKGWIPFLVKTKVLYRRVWKIIAISQKIKECLVKEYRFPKDKIFVIYNPCDVQFIRNLSKEPIGDAEKDIFKDHVVLNVARLVKQKGQGHLIRVFKKVNDENPNSKLVIIGDGPLRPYLEKLISDLCLEEKVLMLGWRSNPFKYMARSKLFCFPSTREGFPNVVVESLACSLPVMSADCLSGPREILAPGTEYKVERLREPEYAEYGILMPVMDRKLYNAKDPLTWQEEVWAEEIIKLLRDPRPLEEYRRKALRRAMDFDAEKQVKKYFEIMFNTVEKGLLFVSSQK